MTIGKRVLLDTHALLWLLGDEARLSERARSDLDRADAVLVSAASVWEISIKRALGRMKAPSDLPAVIDGSALVPLTIRIDHADLAGALPRHHTDPFDRMLVAQALTDDLLLATADPLMEPYDAPLLRL